MSIFQQLLARMFPSKFDRVLLYGLDNAGKTTFLYKVKLGDDAMITTIPTIGFNVESVSFPTIRGTLNIECWDVGGCDKIRPLVSHYLSGVDALVWIVDSSDHERLGHSVHDFRETIGNLDAQQEDRPGSPKQPVLILANKRDLSNVLPLEEIERRFAFTTRDRPFRVFPTSMNRALRDSGSTEALTWLKEQLQFRAAMKNPVTGLFQSVIMKSVNTPSSAELPSSSPNSAQGISQKLESYLTRAENDTPPELFYEQFTKLELPSWDHYTHLRLAFISLVTFGRQKGKNIVLDGIQKYIAESKQTSGRTFHVTMTYFWIQIVHFGIRGMSALSSLTGEAEHPSGGDSESVVGPNDFSQFLMMNPYVADGLLWSDYYSKDVIMSPKAKAEMVLPDKKPLPNLVVRDTVRPRQD